MAEITGNLADLAKEDTLKRLLQQTNISNKILGEMAKLSKADLARLQTGADIAGSKLGDIGKEADKSVASTKSWAKRRPAQEIHDGWCCGG